MSSNSGMGYSRCKKVGIVPGLISSEQSPTISLLCKTLIRQNMVSYDPWRQATKPLTGLTADSSSKKKGTDTPTSNRKDVLCLSHWKTALLFLIFRFNCWPFHFALIRQLPQEVCIGALLETTDTRKRTRELIFVLGRMGPNQPKLISIPMYLLTNSWSLFDWLLQDFNSNNY